MAPDGTDDRPTMADVSHGNPRTGSTLGDVFRRGPAVTDGGTEDEEPGTAARGSVSGDAARDPMREVDHANSNEAVNDVWTRGRGGSADGEDGR